MRIKAEPITAQAFAPYGTFFNVYDMDKNHEGDFAYYPDLAAAYIGGGSLAGFALCGINKREMTANIVEMHENTEEVEFLVNGDNVVLAGARSGNAPDLATFRAFHVKPGTLIRFKRFVWHYVPYPVNNERTMVLTSLPPFTYTNDAVVCTLSDPVFIDL
jgi:ureidoglycolate lyase